MFRRLKRHWDQLGSAAEQKRPPNAALHNQFKRPAAETDSRGGGVGFFLRKVGGGVCVRRVLLHGEGEEDDHSMQGMKVHVCVCVFLLISGRMLLASTLQHLNPACTT